MQCTVLLIFLVFEFLMLLIYIGSRDSTVSIVTGYRLDDRGGRVQVLVGSRIFSSPNHPDWFWGPPSLLSMWVLGALTPGVKRPEREADHSPPTSAEVKKTWIYTSAQPYIFMV
jgi:hypothetical protein